MVARGTTTAVPTSLRGDYRELIGQHPVLRADTNLEHPIEIKLHRSGAATATYTSNHLAYALQVDAFADAIQGKSKIPRSRRGGLAESGNSRLGVAEDWERSSLGSSERIAI